MGKAVELSDVYELCIHSASQLSASVQMISEEKHRGCCFVQNFGLALRSGRESWKHPCLPQCTTSSKMEASF